MKPVMALCNGGTYNPLYREMTDSLADSHSQCCDLTVVNNFRQFLTKRERYSALNHYTADGMFVVLITQYQHLKDSNTKQHDRYLVKLPLRFFKEVVEVSLERSSKVGYLDPIHIIWITYQPVTPFGKDRQPTWPNYTDEHRQIAHESSYRLKLVRPGSTFHLLEAGKIWVDTQYPWFRGHNDPPMMPNVISSMMHWLDCLDTSNETARFYHLELDRPQNEVCIVPH